MGGKNNPSNRIKATKDDWKTSEMPETKVGLPIDQKYSKEEYNEIKQGYIPKGMEDRLFIYFENDKLYLHRSWTGICVYELNFIKKNEKYIISECYLNGKIAEQGNIKGLKDEAASVLSLIEMLLLDKDDSHTV